MTHDERISSYIDNELSTEQEQEFLISLAASDGLRKSFRSELVLKKVLHRDESVTAPSHRLRAAVFTTLGLGAAGLSANKASASEPATATAGTPMHGLVKSLFATKINTFITAAGLSISALAGYGVHSIVAPVSEQVVAHHVVHASNPARVLTPAVREPNTPAASDNTAVLNAEHPMVVSSHLKSHRALAAENVGELKHRTTAEKNTINGTAGGGAVSLEPPKINQPANHH